MITRKRLQLIEHPQSCQPSPACAWCPLLAPVITHLVPHGSLSEDATVPGEVVDAAIALFQRKPNTEHHRECSKDTKKPTDFVHQN